MDRDHIYYIGGGTCCGKSTVCQLLQEKYGFVYYKLDDYIDGYMEKLCEGGNETAISVQTGGNEKMWMRDPKAMCQEEIGLYQDMFTYAQQAIEALGHAERIIAEGAGLMPRLMDSFGVSKDRYVCIVPKESFQIEKYSQRPWIKLYLQDTSDPDQAFANWMARDVLFSKEMAADARRLGYPLLVVDGVQSIAGNLAWIEKCFGLSN